MALREMGVWVGVAGNQTSRAGEILRKLDLPADLDRDFGGLGSEQAGWRILPGADFGCTV